MIAPTYPRKDGERLTFHPDKSVLDNAYRQIDLNAPPHLQDQITNKLEIEPRKNRRHESSSSPLPAPPAISDLICNRH